MIGRILALGILPAAPPEDVVVPPTGTDDPPADAAAQSKPAVPWGLLDDRRLMVTTDAGATHEGLFLGVDRAAAVLVADDGVLVTIPLDEVASVRVLEVVPPAATIPVPTEAATTLVFREQHAVAERERTERMARITRGAAIAGGVLASLSAASSIVAEAFNIRRWSLSKHACGKSYYDDGKLCGWTDGGEPHEYGTYAYDDYENTLGIAAASTIALPLHIIAGPTMLVPSTLLRNRLGDVPGRRRNLAAWALWGAGLGSLVANQAVSWRQVVRTTEACESGPPNRGSCVWLTPSRGAPPGLYLLTAGLTLSSAILGILDANDVARHADHTAAQKSARRAKPMVSLFPFRLQRGGGVGVAGRF